MTVPLDAVERELARLWAATSRKDAHAVTLNLVAFCATPDEVPRARGAVATVAAIHPARTITLACYPTDAPSITARVALHVDTARKGEPTGEDIDLDVRGSARDWVPGALVRLRTPDLPVCLWWVGDIPDYDTLFDKLTEAADAVLIHSAEMDLRDLATLARLVEWSRGSYALGDLNWARLQSWQEFTARFFDDPAARALLPKLDALTVEFSPRREGRDPLSTQAALYAAWVAGALGWKTAAARWTEGSAGPELALTRADGGAVTVRFVADSREGVYPGAINRVELGGGGACLEVARQDDPLVLCWSGDCEGLVVPKQCVRIGTPDESKMLARMLDRPQRDPLYEKTLAVAAALVAPVAPGAPGAPGTPPGSQSQTKGGA